MGEVKGGGRERQKHGKTNGVHRCFVTSNVTMINTKINSRRDCDDFSRVSACVDAVNAKSQI